ncbi:MAG: cation transporting ATPase C-terminal domain-containing protein, partial [Planctomycetota bacterium]
KSVMFMLCTNGAEVTAVGLASFTALPLPLKPLQILYLNVLTDVFPALALGVGAGAPGLMQRPPRRPGEHVLTRAHWIEIGAWSFLIAMCVLVGLWLSGNWLGLEADAAVTVSFLILAFSKLWFTFALRDPGAGILRNEITENPWIWGAVVWCIALLIAAVYLPGLSDILQTKPLSGSAWGLVLGMSVIPFLVGQVVREVQRHLQRRGKQ